MSSLRRWKAIQGLMHTLNTSLIRGDGSALDADVVLHDGLSSLNGNAIISGITALHTKIKILDIDIEVRVDKLRSAKIGSCQREDARSGTRELFRVSQIRKPQRTFSLIQAQMMLS